MHRLCAPRRRGPAASLRRHLPHEAIVFTDTDAANGQNAALEVYRPEYRTEPTVYWKGLPKPWIAGTLIDPDRDEVIIGAQVTAVDVSASDSVSVQSDEFGEFWIRGLASERTYRLEISHPGYQPFGTEVTTAGDQDMGEVCLKLDASPI